MFIFKSIFLFLFFFSTVRAWDSQDLKNEALSPFTTTARNVFYVGAGLTLAVLILEDSIVDYTQADVSNDKPLGSFSKVGDLAGQMLPNALYAFAQTIVGATSDELGYSRAMGMFKASA